MPPGIGYPGMVPVMGPDGTEQYVPEEMFGQAPSLGVEPLQPPEGMLAPAPEPQAPPWAALPSDMPDTQAQPVQPVQQPPWQTSAKVSYSGYGQPQERLPTSKVTAPLYAQRAEIDRADAAAEQVAQDQEQLGQLQVDYDENVTAPMLQGKADILGSYDQVRQNLQRDFEGERNTREASIQQAIDSIPQSDPKRWWKNMSGFQKGAAYISAAIDGYLNPRGPNGAVELASQLADQDARAQAEDIATARAKVGYEQTAYERMLGNQQLKTQDYLAAKETALESLAVATEIRGMSFKSPITKMLYKQQADSMRAERMKVREERLGQLATAETSALDNAAQRAHQTHMQSVSIAASEREAAAKAAAKAKESADAGVLRDPTTGAVVMGRDNKPSTVVGTDAQIADFNTKVAGAFSLEDNLRKFEQLQKKAGRIVAGQYVFNSEDEARATALHNQIMADYVRSISGAQASDKEVERLQKVYPLKKLLSADNAGTITQFRESARTKLRHEINTRTSGGWDGMIEALDKRTGPLPEPPAEGDVLGTSEADPVHGASGQLTRKTEPLVTVQNTKFDPANLGDADQDSVRTVYEMAQTTVAEARSGNMPPELVRDAIPLYAKKASELRAAAHASSNPGFYREQADALSKAVIDLMTIASKQERVFGSGASSAVGATRRGAAHEVVDPSMDPNMLPRRQYPRAD